MWKSSFFCALGLSGLLATVSCSSDEPPATAVVTPDAGNDAAPDVSSGTPDVASTPDVRAEAPSAGDAADGADGPSGLEFAPAYPKVTFPPENPFKAETAMLGKILFWEEQIGELDNMACGTCHRSKSGGSDPRSAEPASLFLGKDGVLGTPDDVRGGKGVIPCSHQTHMPLPDAGTVAQVTGRKPPSYFDAMFYPNLFWDGRAGEEFKDPIDGHTVIPKGAALETQASGPPANSTEMACGGATAAQIWADIATKIATATPLTKAKFVPIAMAQAISAAQGSYPNLFQSAFGTPDVTPAHIVMAIATHERTLTSNDTPWDRFNGGEQTALSAAQKRGLVLFNTKARCNLCHQPPLFSDAVRIPGVNLIPDAGLTDGFHNVGFLDPSIDPGRGKGKMKTPTLRNVGLREAGGLLHNGTGNGASLPDVLNAYKAGGSVATDRDELMVELDLSTAELADLLDFLRNGLTDARVKDEQPPFDRPILGTEPVK